MDLLEVSGLNKRYGGIVALSSADFSARAGEVHALLGENGAGKSTLIQILAGAVAHDGGSIRVNGALYAPTNPDAAIAAGIAAVFQELSLVPDLTVEQNIWFRHETLSGLGTVRRREMRRKTMELFEKYQFPRLAADQEVRRLTLAERQIVEIAKGLASDPKILILDEATSTLPAREAEWLLGMTRKLADEGKLVVFISHRMAEVRHIADRLTIFRNGSTVAAHEANAVSDDVIVAQMLGRKLDRLYPERIATATDRIALQGPRPSPPASGCATPPSSSARARCSALAACRGMASASCSRACSARHGPVGAWKSGASRPRSTARDRR